MPTYVFVCVKCGREEELRLRMADRDKPRRCPNCKARLKRSYEGLRFNLRKYPPMSNMSESDIENLP